MEYQSRSTSENGVIISKRPTNDNSIAVKIEGYVNASPMTLMKVFFNSPKYRRQYDSAFGTQTYISRIADQLWVNYSTSIKLPFITPRDWHLAVGAFLSPEGALQIPYFSVDDESIVPQKKDFIRSVIYVSNSLTDRA